jgi:hypothetical protein
MLHTTLIGPRREEALATLDQLMADVAPFHGRCSCLAVFGVCARENRLGPKATISSKTSCVEC